MSDDHTKGPFQAPCERPPKSQPQELKSISSVSLLGVHNGILDDDLLAFLQASYTRKN